MQQKNGRNFIVLFFVAFLFAFCNKEEDLIVQSASEEIPQKPPVTGSRIAWDHSTLKNVSPDGVTGYNGYARVIQLHNKSLLCVYESRGNVVVVTSNDLGTSWTEPVTVAAKESGINMAVPDVLQLQDNSILIAYNPRPFNIDPSRRFAIRTKKSYDGGLTWKDERLLHEAGYQFENGCWEPSAIQLPDGEIQLFFANEGPYTSSNEQEISLLRSSDGGLSWTAEPETVSFRAGSRDGMPVPLLVKDYNEIIVAIEDNGHVTFKPYIIRSTIDNNWSTVINGDSPRRSYALADKINDYHYAGAPYLGQLTTGEIILSYQGTEGRSSNQIEAAEMKVTIGSAKGLEFNRKTSPFNIPDNRSGLWNSIRVLDDNTIIALTSTNGYSGDGRTEVWMIKGYMIPELKAKSGNISVDGAQNEGKWKEEFPIFIGHKSFTQIRSHIVYDDQFLYVISEIQDENVIRNTPDPENTDGTTVYLDAGNKSYGEPHIGVFSIFLSADNEVVVKEGNNGKWMIRKDINGIESSSKIINSGYVQELAIPWSLLDGKPELNTRVGFNIRLTENSGKGEPDYKEDISSNNGSKPFSWMTLTLE
jgi:hypothetical protein